jgi:hypothetical protein
VRHLSSEELRRLGGRESHAQPFIKDERGAAEALERRAEDEVVVFHITFLSETIVKHRHRLDRRDWHGAGR